MIATGVITPFLIPMKIAFMAAFLAALPYVLYQAWAFVAPGLYAHEKRLVLPLVVSSTMLFFVGMAFCYFIVFRRVFAFIAHFAPKSISVAPDIEAYFNFVLGMFVAFGLAFEVPVVVVVLVLRGDRERGAAARLARLRDRGDLRRRGYRHSAGRGVAGLARGADVPALRGGHPGRPDGGQAAAAGRPRRRSEAG